MMTPTYKSLLLEKDKKSFLKDYHIDLDPIQLFINLQITAFDFETEAHNIGESFLEIVQKHINEASEQPLYNRFEESLKELNFFLNDLKNKKESGDIGKINAVIGILENNVLHVTKTGLSESYLLRKGNIIDISEGLYSERESEQDYFINIASGDLEPGDKIIFTSKRLLKFLQKSEINSIFITSDIVTSFEELHIALLAEDTGDMIISGLIIEKQREKTKEYQAYQEEEESQLEKEEEEGAQKDFIFYVRKTKKLILFLSKKIIVFTKKLIQNSKDPAQRKNVIVGGSILVILVFLIGITMLLNNKTSSGQLQEYEKTLQMSYDLLAKAQHEKLYDINQAKASLGEAEKKAIEVKKSGLYYKNALEILQTIEKEKELMDKIIRVSNPDVVVDLSKKDGSVDAIGLVNLKKAFYVLTGSSILGPIVDSSPDSYTKNSTNNGEIFVSADKFLDRDNIVILTQSNKVLEFNKDNTFSFMDTEDATWKSGTEIKTYATRQYIYILDPAENTIWKYERTSKKYRQSVSYNMNNVDIKDAISFTVDGNVYVLKKNGEVKKFYAQKEQPFAIEGGPSIPLGDLDTRAKIYTTENLRNIYILEPGKERVLIYKKTTFEKTDKMTYDAQYVFEGMDLRDMYIDDAEQSIYVLTPQKVLKVDIKGMQ